MTAASYVRVLLLFGAQRLAELLYSAANERSLRRRQPDVAQAGRSVWKWIVAVNLALFTIPALERRLRRRPPSRWLASVGWMLALSALALRLSVVATLRSQWNARALVPADLQVIDRGPYRWVRHPNYLALGLEFLGLPLIGGAYISAAGLSLANSLLLRRRINEEDSLLMAMPAYRERMGHKPAFVPRRISVR
jgi:methyltransferase